MLRRPLQNHSLPTGMFHAHPMGLEKTSLLPPPVHACVWHTCAQVCVHVCREP